MNDDLERLTKQRAEHSTRVAGVLVACLAGLSAGDADDAVVKRGAAVGIIARLLTEAYEDGRRDMYALVDEQLKPLWQVAGLEP
jgi:hypothetical protein